MPSVRVNKVETEGLKYGVIMNYRVKAEDQREGKSVGEGGGLLGVA